jgi:hypothetical protein
MLHRIVPVLLYRESAAWHLKSLNEQLFPNLPVRSVLGDVTVGKHDDLLRGTETLWLELDLNRGLNREIHVKNANSAHAIVSERLSQNGVRGTEPAVVGVAAYHSDITVVAW